MARWELGLAKKQWLIIVLAFLLPLFGVFAWWGGFNRVEITEAQAGPYRYVYLEHTGDYGNLPKTQARVRALMEEQKIPRGASITVLLDDPRKVPRDRLRARTGYLVGPGVMAQEPLRLGEIPRRPVLVASVRAAALLAPSKAYQALHEYLQQRRRELVMPTVEIYESPSEIYRMGVMQVEMER